MVDDISTKVIDIVIGEEVCAVMYRSPSGAVEAMEFLTEVLERMTYLEAIGAILDNVDEVSGGLTDMDKRYLIAFLRSYLIDITK